MKEAMVRVHNFYYKTLHWCACGNPEDVMQFMGKVLEVIRWNFEEGRGRPYEEFKAKIEPLLGKIGSPLCLTYFYVLDRAGLTEHGGGLVNGGWLTCEGIDLLADLKLIGDAEWDNNEIYDLASSSASPARA